WFAAPAGLRAVRDLLFQACTGTGCGLQHAAARAETCASCQNRRNPRKSVRGDLREPARAGCASLPRGGRCGKGGRLFVCRRRPRAVALALKEAHEHITQALQLLSRLPDDDIRRRGELKLQTAPARTLQEQKGYGDQQVGEAYAKAREFSKRV